MSTQVFFNLLCVPYIDQESKLGDIIGHTGPHSAPGLLAGLRKNFNTSKNSMERWHGYHGEPITIRITFYIMIRVRVMIDISRHTMRELCYGYRAESYSATTSFLPAGLPRSCKLPLLLKNQH